MSTQITPISFQVKVTLKGNRFVIKINAESWWDAYKDVLRNLANAEEKPEAISVRPVMGSTSSAGKSNFVQAA